MAIHVQDPETDRLLREFAKKRQVGLTAAIKLAVREADEAVERRIAGRASKHRTAYRGSPIRDAQEQD